MGHKYGQCYPIASDFQRDRVVGWCILERFSADLYLISRTQNSRVRYAPLYIHRFPLCAPRKLLEATSLNRQYQRYEQIQTVPDRLRWLRHSRGLMQKEVAAKIGMSHHAYKSIEEGITRRFDKGMRERKKSCNLQKLGEIFQGKAVKLWAVENNITNGVDATHFGSARNCNRAQVVTFLYRAYK